MALGLDVLCDMRKLVLLLDPALAAGLKGGRLLLQDLDHLMDTYGFHGHDRQTIRRQGSGL